MQNDNFMEEQIDNIENLMGTNIKIRTLDGEFQVKIDVEKKVQELKRKIEDVLRVINKNLDFESSYKQTEVNFQREIIEGHRRFEFL